MRADELSYFHRINIVRQKHHSEGIYIIDRAATIHSVRFFLAEVREEAKYEMLFGALAVLVCESDFWMRHDSVLLQQTIIQF